MTAQMSESLTYKGEKLSMCECPLHQYLELAKVRLGLGRACTALWRGYVGSWEIIDDRLYLTELSAPFNKGSDLSVASLFPDFPDRVFAHWYSGTLRIPQGQQLEYVHMGFQSRHERDLLLEVERGVVVRTEVRHNAPDSSDSSPGGYEVGGMTVFSGGGDSQ